MADGLSEEGQQLLAEYAFEGIRQASTSWNNEENEVAAEEVQKWITEHFPSDAKFRPYWE